MAISVASVIPSPISQVIGDRMGVPVSQMSFVVKIVLTPGLISLADLYGGRGVPPKMKNSLLSGTPTY